MKNRRRVHDYTENAIILLSQGVVLNVCPGIEDYYVLIPCHRNYTLNVVTLQLDLKEYGLEMMDEEECEFVYTDHATKVWCASIRVEDIPIEHRVREATHHAELVCA